MHGVLVNTNTLCNQLNTGWSNPPAKNGRALCLSPTWKAVGARVIHSPSNTAANTSPFRCQWPPNEPQKSQTSSTVDWQSQTGSLHPGERGQTFEVVLGRSTVDLSTISISIDGVLGLVGAIVVIKHLWSTANGTKHVSTQIRNLRSLHHHCGCSLHSPTMATGALVWVKKNALRDVCSVNWKNPKNLGQPVSAQISPKLPKKKQKYKSKKTNMGAILQVRWKSWRVNPTNGLDC